MSQYAVIDPATETKIREYPVHTDAMLREQLTATVAAQTSWSKDTTVEERAQLIHRVGEIHEERRRELAEAITQEMGKPIEQSLGEIDFCVEIYKYNSEAAPICLADMELAPRSGRALIRSAPLGVLLGVMPWNYPAYQVARFAAPNLAIGNGIMLKHAPQCPDTAALLEDIFAEAGFPENLYTNVYASNKQVADLIADPRVRGVSVTGSERAGQAIAETAGRHLKKVVMELGGSDPFILLGTDDLDHAVEKAVAARLDNTGQACNAAKRFIIADELYEQFAAKFIARFTSLRPADPSLPDTYLGPLSSTSAADRIEEQVSLAVSCGATLHGNLDRRGNFVSPVVLTGVQPKNPAYHQEFFGPVATLYRVNSEAEAVKLANDSPYGLGSYVFSNDKNQAMRVANQLEAGMVFINVVGAEEASLPFGGVKNSGIGRELGTLGFGEFVNKKLIRID